MLIVRDLMVRGFRTFKELCASGEGISTNILADRLRSLEAKKLIASETDGTDGRRLNYRLTKKGIDLAPVLLELVIWAARHEKTGGSCAQIERLERNREALIAEVRRRWENDDRTPLERNGRWLWP